MPSTLPTPSPPPFHSPALLLGAKQKDLKVSASSLSPSRRRVSHVCVAPDGRRRWSREREKGLSCQYLMREEGGREGGREGERKEGKE